MARTPSDKPKAPKTTNKGAKAKTTADRPETTGPDQAKPSGHPLARTTSFKPGQSGNPDGRPKGIRHKLSTNFLEVLEKDFRTHGVAAIQKMREEKPVEYVKTVASIVPKAFDLGDEDDGDGNKVIGVALITRNAIEAIIQRGRDDGDA